MYSNPTPPIGSRGAPGRSSLIVGAAIAGAVVITGFAFTASNNVPTTKAGDGSGTVSGYAATGIDYVLNGTDPSKIDSVTYTLNPTPTAGSTIKTKVGGNWYECTNIATAITCATTSPQQATLALHDSLQIVVAD